jgi:(4-(4-[2-(gamma-L-glutamylamino)ethyl]phenoxymethyl)furan-2-yl)methanamine synthase
MPRDAIGLDIGGANIKAATASGRAVSVPFELWRQPDQLTVHLAHIGDLWADSSMVAVTMTGELCDCFSTKRDGVRHILAATERAFPRRSIRAWSTVGRFVRIDEAVGDHLAVAAANWHALATFIGRDFQRRSAVLVDTGSTTTDVIPILDGVPVTTGKTDPDRLRSGELIYTGVRRTPVCAILGSEVAAEWFATTHDVYVRLGELPAEPNNRATADGRPMTDEFAHARLSRMLGGDAEITLQQETMNLARRVFDAQRRMIGNGIRMVVGRLPTPPEAVCVAGSGEFLAREAWDEVVESGDAGFAPVESLSERFGPTLTETACAYAVARLALEEAP